MYCVMEMPPAIVCHLQMAQYTSAAYAVGTNDPNSKMTVESAKRIIEVSRQMGIEPLFLLPNQKGDKQYAQNSRALQEYLDQNRIKYVLPEYGDKDPYHMTLKWVREFSSANPSPFIAGDSNAVLLGRIGYHRSVPDNVKMTDPQSGAVLGWGGKTSKTIADELEKHLKWFKSKPRPPSTRLAEGKI
jgi:hypothetical protein